MRHFGDRDHYDLTMSNQTSEPSGNAAGDDTVTYCEHVVAFIDVLGQKEALAKIDRIPTPKERDQFIKALKNSAGRVGQMIGRLATVRLAW
jgi:hypothetical protein